MGQQVDMWPKNKISSKLPQIGSKLPQDNPVHENIVHTNNKQTQNELFMFEVGGLDGPEAILLETGKSGKTDKWIYLTTEYISITNEWTVTLDKQGKPSFPYDEVEECIKMQCVFSF